MNKYIEKINIKDAYKILTENELNPDDLTDYTVGVFINKTLVATGSLYENIIKLVAVKKEYQKENLLSLITTNLINELTKRGYSKYFLFTKDTNANYFLNLGFSLIISSKGVSYLENNLNPITETLKALKGDLNLNNKSVGALIVNCNPPTLGHIYLITEASLNHDYLLVFLVSENKSYFSYDVRCKLLSESIKNLNNVIVLPSTNYLISSSTFPTYFLKDLSLKSEIEMHLDVSIFIKYFIKIFNIEKRYVGSEENDSFTNQYNETLKHYLNEKLIIIPRIKKDNTIISASTVRKLYAEGELIKLKKFVPEATYNYLASIKAKE